MSDMDFRLNIFDTEKDFRQIRMIEPGPCNLYINLVKVWKFDIFNNEITWGCYSITRYDIDSSHKIADLNNDLRYIYSFQYINQYNLAVGNANGSINIFSLETNKRIHKIEKSCMAIRSLSIDDINKRLISASDDLHINIIDLEKIKVIQTMVGHKDSITGISSQNNLFYSCGYDGCIKTWDTRAKTSSIDTIFVENSCNDIAINQDDMLVASDSSLYILNK